MLNFVFIFKFYSGRLIDHIVDQKERGIRNGICETHLCGISQFFLILFCIYPIIYLIQSRINNG